MKAFLKLSKNNDFVSNDETHICIVDEKKVQNLPIMKEIKDNISNNENIYNVKPSIRKDIKRRNDKGKEENEIKEEDNYINIKKDQHPNYDHVKSTMYRFINKNIPQDL